MLFRDDQQRAATCRAMLGLVELEDLWELSGPTDRVKRLRGPDAPHAGDLSHGAQLRVALVWDIGNGRGGTDVRNLRSIVDPDKLAAIGALLVAAVRGPRGIDEWLAEHQSSSTPSGAPQ